MRTVHELEHAGAAAMILEDQVFPKRCGHAAGKAIIPLDQYMRKLECALEARQTSMVVVARTDATSIDEGIVRAKRFHAAGADVTLIDGLPSVEALERVGEEVPGHKVINLIHGGKTPLLPSQQLHDLGFKIVLYSTPALYTATRTMLEAMTAPRRDARARLDLRRERDVPRLPGAHREQLLPASRRRRALAGGVRDGTGQPHAAPSGGLRARGTKDGDRLAAVTRASGCGPT